MANMKNVAETRSRLEEIYMGIPDESVNLTFQDLANFNQNKDVAADKKQPSSGVSVKTLSEVTAKSRTPSPRKGNTPVARLPSLDFNTGLQASQAQNNHRQRQLRHSHYPMIGDNTGHHHHQQKQQKDDYDPFGHATMNQTSPRIASKLHELEKISNYDDLSSRSRASSCQDRSGRRRQGVPHSTICAVCSTNCYIFRTRCLVCGRAYCRQCLEIGMGEMVEGRKCIDCLGLKFSQRYIQRAGKMGCCGWRYPSTVKQAELKWAEKGPRRTGDRGYSHGVTTTTPSRPRSPMTMKSPKGYGSNEPSFVGNSTYSPYMSPIHNHLPL